MNRWPTPSCLNSAEKSARIKRIERSSQRLRVNLRLVGLDTPSVDLLDDKKLLAHTRFLVHGMSIIEGLALTEVPEGRYELVALPLRLVGFDGSPVRAVLRSLT